MPDEQVIDEKAKAVVEQPEKVEDEAKTEVVEPSETDVLKQKLEEEKERRIKSEARNELLSQQLESIVINQAAPRAKEEIVIDDGFVQSTDEVVDNMTPSQLLRYKRAEDEHNERVKTAKAEQAEAKTPDRQFVKAQTEINTLKDEYGEELMEDIAPFMLQILNKDAKAGKAQRSMIDYFKQAKPIYEKIAGVKIGEETKIIPIETIKKEVPKKPIIISEHPVKTSGVAPRTDMDIDSALDEGMKAGFGKTGRDNF